MGIPASIQNLLNVTGMTILNNLTSVYGTSAVAAIGITQKVNLVPTQIAMGLSQGIMPLISYCYASKNIERMKQTIITSIKICAIFAFSVAFIYYIHKYNFILYSCRLRIYSYI